jgi:hypothetical protein
MIGIAALSTGAYAVIGVAIGSAFSFVTVVVTNWTTASQARQQRRTLIRQERKAAILAFVEIGQEVERLAELRFQDQEIANATASTDRMWVLLRSLDLVATAQLRAPASSYAWGLNDAVYKKLTDVLVEKDMTYEDIYAFLGAKRDPFLDAARRELDVPTLEGGRSY